MQIEVTTVQIYKSELKNTLSGSVDSKFENYPDEASIATLHFGEIPSWIIDGLIVSWALGTSRLGAMFGGRKSDAEDIEREIQTLTEQNINAYFKGYEAGFAYLTITIKQCVNLEEEFIQENPYYWILYSKTEEMVSLAKTTLYKALDTLTAVCTEKGFDSLISPKTLLLDKLFFSAEHKITFCNIKFEMSATAQVISKNLSEQLQASDELPKLIEHFKQIKETQPSNRPIFISYSRTNEDYAKQLRQELEQRGFNVWFEQNSIDFGSDSWWEEIEKGIVSSGAVIVIMTPEAENSQWVRKEVLLALNERKPIFPLLLDGQGFKLLVDKNFDDVRSGKLPRKKFFKDLAIKMDS